MEEKKKLKASNGHPYQKYRQSYYYCPNCNEQTPRHILERGNDELWYCRCGYVNSFRTK